MLLQHPQYSDHYYNTKTKEICRIWINKKGNRKVKVKKMVPNNNGYLSLKIYLGNKRYKFFTAHRFMAECCAGRRLGKKEHIDHIDQDPYNNALSNLRIVSRTANLLNTNKSKGITARHTKTMGTRYQVWFRSVYQGVYDTREEAKAHYEALKQAALEAELDGVITLQQMIEEVA
jgi:hypothetical protein